MKIDDLEVGNLYTVLRKYEDRQYTGCIRTTCKNLTSHYQGARQFRCSDHEGCGMIYALGDREAQYTFAEADKPGKHLRELGLINDGIDYTKIGDLEEAAFRNLTNELLEGMNKLEGMAASAIQNPEEQNISIESIQAAMEDHNVHSAEWSFANYPWMPPIKPPIPEARVKIFKELDKERKAQTAKWGMQTFPSLIPVVEAENDLTKGALQCFAYGLSTEHHAREACEKAAKDGTLTWGHIFVEEVSETFAATNEEDLRKELIQALAVGVQWLEDLDKKLDPAKVPYKWDPKYMHELIRAQNVRVPQVFLNEFLGVPVEAPCECKDFTCIHSEPGRNIYQCNSCQGTRTTHPRCEVYKSACPCIETACEEYAMHNYLTCVDCTEKNELRRATTVPAKAVTDPDIIAAIADAEAGEGFAFTLPAPEADPVKEFHSYLSSPADKDAVFYNETLGVPFEEEPCMHINTQPHRDHVTCNDCGWVKTDSGSEYLPKKES